MLEKAIEVMKLLIQNNHQAYLVGGCVRDYLMDITPVDYDIATNALPNEIKNLFEKTLDFGIKHGTVKVKYKGSFFEITTFRYESKYLDSRRPSNVEFISSIDEDLKRRDFRINAIALDENLKIYDPLNGIEDIKDRIIKTVNSPDKRFKEDALRMLRAIRFSCQLGFEIDMKTKKSIEKNRHLILNISKERITQELLKAISSKYPENIKSLFDTKLSYELSPKCIPFDYYRLRRFDSDPTIRLAAFLHYSNFTTDYLVLSNKEKKLLRLLKKDLKTDEYSLKEYLNMFGYESLIKYFDYSYQKTNNAIYQKAKQTIQYIEQNNIPYSIKDLAVNGSDLIELGIKDGSKIGLILNKMLKWVLKHPRENKKDILIKNFIKK